MSVEKGFSFDARAAEARAAHRAIDETFARLRNRDDLKDPATIAWSEAIARFHAATSAAYPKHFRRDFERLKTISRYYVASNNPPRALKKGDLVALETAIRFLEADPMFFGSGYAKADLLRFVKRMPLTDAQRQRLGQAALNVVDRRASQEFRRYCRLAEAVASADLLAGLESRAASCDAKTALRAKWMTPYVERGLRRDQRNEKMAQDQRHKS